MGSRSMGRMAQLCRGTYRRLIMKKEPNPAELEEITAAARRGDKVHAISLYITATGAGLTEAQNFIRALGAVSKPEVSSPEQKVQGSRGKR